MQPSSLGKKYSPERNQQVINNPKRRPQDAKDFAAYTGLPRSAARQWARDPQQYLNGLMQQTLDSLAAVQVPPTPAAVSLRDKLLATLKGGSMAYSVSFLPAKACVNLFGWLATLLPEHARALFMAGAAGYNLSASILHPTSTRIVAGSLAANYGGPQPLDKATLDNAITLWCMGLVKRADGQDDSDIQSAIREIADAVIARATAEAEKGTPLSHDYRSHPILGSAARTWGFHASFFSFSFMYLLAGGLTPVERQFFMNMSGPVALRSGLFNLTDLLVWMVCGEIAGMMTLAGQLLTNATVQHGPEKLGLNQTWQEELEAALEKLGHIVPLHTQLVGVRNAIRRNIRASQVGDEEKQRRAQVFKEKVLPLLDDAIGRLDALQAKHEGRARLLKTERGRWELTRNKIGATVLKGAGKTPHKLINGSSQALRIRTASEILGNMLSLLAFSYSIVHMYTLFSTTMPFRETNRDDAAAYNVSQWDTTAPASFNRTAGEPHTPVETQIFSTLLGVILIAAFSTRALFIPLVEVVLNLLHAGGLRSARALGLRGQDTGAASSDDGPPPPDDQPDETPDDQPDETPSERIDDVHASGRASTDSEAFLNSVTTRLDGLIDMIDQLNDT